MAKLGEEMSAAVALTSLCAGVSNGPNSFNVSAPHAVVPAPLNNHDIDLFRQAVYHRHQGVQQSFLAREVLLQQLPSSSLSSSSKKKDNIELKPIAIENSRQATFSSGNNHSASTSTSKITSEIPKKKRNFALKLFDLLETGFHSDVITWLPGGKAFIVLDKGRFANEILPHYFKESQFTSFTRKLSRWKFTRVSRGPYMGAYYHSHFQQNDRMRCKLMSCCNHNTSETVTKKTDEDFLLVTAPATTPNADANANANANAKPSIKIKPSTKKNNKTIVIPSRNATLVRTQPQESVHDTRDFGRDKALTSQTNSMMMHRTNRHILAIKQQLIEIRKRKARIEKKKRLLMMRAEAEERFKGIQCLKNAVLRSLSIQQQQAETNVIDAAARALDSSSSPSCNHHVLNQSIIQNGTIHAQSLLPLYHPNSNSHHALMLTYRHQQLLDNNRPQIQFLSQTPNVTNSNQDITATSTRRAFAA